MHRWCWCCPPSPHVQVKINMVGSTRQFTCGFGRFNRHQEVLATAHEVAKGTSSETFSWPTKNTTNLDIHAKFGQWMVWPLHENTSKLLRVIVQRAMYPCTTWRFFQRAAQVRSWTFWLAMGAAADKCCASERFSGILLGRKKMSWIWLQCQCLIFQTAPCMFHS